MRVLIAGCGYVGTALGVRLAAEGHEVFALRRRPQSLPAPLVRIAADLGDPGSLAGVPPGLEIVFYTAAASARSEAAYRAAYVTGLQRLLAQIARRSSVRRIFFTSSTSVYAQRRGEWVDEASPTEPARFAGRLVLQGEGVLRRASVPSTAIRFGGIYGPGRCALLERVRRGEATWAAGPPRYTNRIHRDDCAGVLRFLMHLEAPEPVYLGVDSDPAPERTVLAWLAERLGAPPPREGPPADGPGSKRCSNRKLLANGYDFLYPSFRDGYEALIAAGATGTVDTAVTRRPAKEGEVP